MELSAYWWQDISLKREPRNLPSEADVVIIGGGFTGLSAGLAMLRAGRSVVILDKGQPGMGASTRNGGICSGNIRLSHARLEALGGKDYADALYAEGAEARSDLAKFIKRRKNRLRLSARSAGVLARYRLEITRSNSEEAELLQYD